MTAPTRQALRLARRAHRVTTSRFRPLPDFVVIGVQRGGTTSLFRYLAQHPRIEPATAKEIHFFDQRYDRGLAWYRSHFPSSFGRAGYRRLTGEASPYNRFHPLVPQRIARAMPGVKLIALLRDPVRRAYSHYHHERAKGRETLSFEDAIAAENERLSGERERIVREGSDSEAYRCFSYLARGRYAEQLRGWLDLFPADQLLVLKSEDLYAAPRCTLHSTLGFLGLASHDEMEFRRHNERTYDDMKPATRNWLESYFSPRNAELRLLFGPRIEWGY